MDEDYEFIDDWNHNKTLNEEGESSGNILWAILLILLILGLVGVSVFLWSERRKKKIE